MTTKFTEDSSSREQFTGKRERYVFLSAVAQVSQNPAVLRPQIFDILMASRDTTAALLSWVIWILAREEKVFSTLQKEIKQQVGVGRSAKALT
jgi:cytochrome P450